MSRQLIILAGGAGTRLRARLGDLPKPMMSVTVLVRNFTPFTMWEAERIP